VRFLWLLPLLPLAGSALNGVAGIRYFSRRVTSAVACGAMFAAFAVAVAAVAGLMRLPPDERVHEVVLGTWIPPIPLATSNGIGHFGVDWAFRLDPLAAVMILVVTGIGLLIHIYSVGYMHEESPGAYARFFSYLNLFCAFMLTLVLGSNFLVMFIGWEGVGLCSYLLIGYWYEKKSASDAGKKAFITNRIGDWGFLLGMFGLFFMFGTLDFRAIATAAASTPVESAHFGALSVLTLLLFVGATGKSAQIPLYVWLPDAMEGPTPVSALIHAATMVTAGVYMVCRNAVLFSHAPLVMTIVAIIGALTALMAATIGLVQTDIKRVLAYSTVSQLGYMFLGAGVGAYSAAIFHLMTHAFFKALLFLGSGAVIHAMAGEQDMNRMGSLKRYLPVTFVTMMIGALAIAGIPPFAGFFSKDEILAQTFEHNRILWVLGSLTALMTAFYMFRLMAMTFYGSYRGPAFAQTAGHAASPAAAAIARDHGARHPLDPDAHDQAQVRGHDVTHGPAHPVPTGPSTHTHEWHGPHEAPGSMTVPLMVLAVGAMVAGFVGIPAALGGSNAFERFLEPSVATHVAVSPVGEHTAVAGEPVTAETHAAQSSEVPRTATKAAEWGLMLLAVTLAVIGISTAWRFYITRPQIAVALAERWPGMHSLLYHKYYVDEFYGSTFIKATFSSARDLWIFDGRIVDGFVNGWGALTRLLAWVSHLFDKVAVDGLVNAVGWSADEGSYAVRRGQTGLVQNYALFILLGVCVFLSVYLIAR
jgi:NADH-quinone oxidoreductase subunit L